MVKKIIAFATRILKKRLCYRSPILIACLFFISMTITPVIAQVSSQQNVWQLTSQATEFYQAKNWKQAAQSWQRVANIFASQEDKLNQAMALSNLSLTYQQLGKWQGAKTAIAESRTILEKQPPSEQQQLLLSQSLDIQGKLQQEIGQYQNALETWQQAQTIYQQIGNQDRLIQNQINQAEAMQSLGYYPLACKTLLASLDLEHNECKLPKDNQTLFKQTLSPVKAKALFSLADVLRVTVIL